jgi:transposase-like protein
MKQMYQRTPKEKREEIVVAYLTGDNSVEELAEYYKVKAATIRTWIKRYRQSKKVVPLQPETNLEEDMARKKKDTEKSADILALEARIRELELQNLALNTLIDVAERNGIEIRKKSGAKQ